MSTFRIGETTDGILDVEPIAVEVYATPSGEEVGRAVAALCPHCGLVHTSWMPLKPWAEYPYGSACLVCMLTGEFRISRCYPYPARLVSVTVKDAKEAWQEYLWLASRPLEMYLRMRKLHRKSSTVETPHHGNPTGTTKQRDVALPPGRTKRPPTAPLDPRPIA